MAQIGLFGAEAALQDILNKRQQEATSQRTQLGNLFASAASNKGQAATNQIAAQIGAGFGQGAATGLFGEGEQVEGARANVEEERALQAEQAKVMTERDPIAMRQFAAKLYEAGFPERAKQVMDIVTAPAKERKILKDVNGVQRYVDTEEKVFTEVEANSDTDPDAHLHSVGGGIYNRKTGSWLMPPQNAKDGGTATIKTRNAKGENVTQLIDKNTGSVVAEYPAQVDGVDMSSSMEKAHIKALEEESKSATEVHRLDNALKDFEKLPDFGGGLPLTIEGIIKDNVGIRDAKSAALTVVQGFRASEAMKYLPPGPASDKDVALALSGQPPANAGKAEWLSYMRGVQKLSRRKANYYRDYDSFISKYGDVRGFGSRQELKSLDSAILALPTNGNGNTPLDIYNSVPANSKDKEGARKLFIEKYQFDPERSEVLRRELAEMGR